MMLGPGLAAMPMPEWKVRTAKGKEYVADSEAEAREMAGEYGPGSSVWERQAYRGIALTTISSTGWYQVA
ncbi:MULTISPECIES: hypothetical protein [unclassified Streptomyces]|uniref:hypothetical protein n=1 Tax=unclassified Streptomyces TaxID=2593676 RepID=UPI0013A702E1|nr:MULTISPECIES: hypothetical protein [unclassified Streptomyces]